MSAATSIRLANRREELRRLTDELERFAEAHALPLAALGTLAVVVEEVVSNVIKYGYDDDGEHTIEVRLALEGDTLWVEVEDDARPFDPLAASEADLAAPIAARPVGGLGIPLIRRLTDEQRYERRRGRNVLTLRKRGVRSA